METLVLEFLRDSGERRQADICVMPDRLVGADQGRKEQGGGDSHFGLN